MELKRQKELERKIKLQEAEQIADNEETKEIKNEAPPKDVEMVDTSAASPDKSSPVKPGSPSIADFKYERREDMQSADDIWYRTEYSYYHSLSDLQSDFELVFNHIQKTRCLNLLA